jgi:uncharacterized membrane protein YhaH (DUF805 family)
MFKLFFSPGRISRRQYWIVNLLVIPLLGFLFAPLYKFYTEGQTTQLVHRLTVLTGVVPFAFWSNFCASVKRYHDRGKSGWWYLLIFGPVIGEAWHFIECGLLPGEKTTNAYGLPPGSRHAPAPKIIVEPPTVFERYEKSIQDSNAILVKTTNKTSRP